MIFMYTGSLQLNMELYEPEMNGRDCDDYHHDHWKGSQNDAKFVVTDVTVTTYDATSDDEVGTMTTPGFCRFHDHFMIDGFVTPTDWKMLT